MAEERPVAGYENCNGCGVCTLPCPIWQQRHEAVLTFAGRARALQGGADIEELRDSVGACLLCGSCEPVCAMGIQTVDVTLKLRAKLAGQGQGNPPRRRRRDHARGRAVLLPGAALAGSGLLDAVARLLQVPVAADTGQDVIEAYEQGRSVDDGRVMAFLETLEDVGRVVTDKGLVKRYLRGVLPGLKAVGLGEALLGVEGIEECLKPTDLYIIEARSYNMDFSRCMPFYTELSRRTGCGMNLDLQRVAIPTGTWCTRGAAGGWAPEAHEQIRWILDGRGFDRAVVEAVEDIEPLKALVNMPVIHVAELLSGAGP